MGWNARSGVLELALHWIDGSVERLRNLPASCDFPFSISFHRHRTLAYVPPRSFFLLFFFLLFHTFFRLQVEAETANPFVSIDAVEFTSVPGQSVCQVCPQRQFRLLRSPPFQTVATRKTTGPVYLDE